MLKSLEINGFKSFAKKTELNFQSKITAIVGPNGSGKSNVAEAFRFVLGEQSIKSMRGKKGEDLIWNGSTETARSNRASVKLVFDNLPDLKKDNKKLFSIDFDEVSIERVVNRDGTNEYSINGSKVRLKDIMELLAQAHIGSSGHHIISQGEADRILTSNDKERRMMIEDALGLKIYQYKREESQRKLLKTKENITQVEALRKEIAPHLRFLRKQVEKVVKASSLKDELVEKYKIYLTVEKKYLENSKQKIETNRNLLLARKKELKRLVEEAQAVIELSSNVLSRSEDLLQVEAEVRAFESKKNELLREVGKLEGEIRAYERALERVKTEAEDKVIPFSKINIFKDEVNSFIQEATAIGTLESALKSLQNIKIRIESIVSEYSSNTETEFNTVEIKTLEENRQKLESEIFDIESKINTAKENYDNIKSVLEKDKDSGREAEKTLFNLLSEQNRINTEISLLESMHSKNQIEEENFRREIEEALALLGQRAVGLERSEITLGQEERTIQEDRRREIERIKIRLEEAGAADGEEIMKEFNETQDRDQFLEKELLDLNTSALSLEKLIEELKQKLDTEFAEGIKKINKSFSDFFSLMFDGGEAELKLVKNSKLKNKNFSEDNLRETIEIEEENKEQEDGIDIRVSLPRKRIKGLEMLSGGERALTSIALLFAISQVNPPPFVILDETDAALDEANSKKYGDMIENLSKYSQLILITHNRETMSRAGVIYGVTMGKDGVSRLLSIAFDEAISVAK